MTAQPARALMTIGDVLGLLREDFPDVTISKIRFLEAEGLVTPQRSPAGYRKFSDADVERLRFVLTAQRDHYLPLRVIRQRLEALDRGEPLPPPDARPADGRPDGRPDGRADGGNGAAPRGAGDPRPGEGRGPRTLVAADAAAPGPQVRLTRRQLLDGAGIDEALLAQLEEYGLVGRNGTHYDGEALTVARTAAALGEFGFEARHLRAVKAAADRQVGLVEQVVAPQLRRRSPGAHEQAADTARRIADLAVRLHAALVATGLRESLDP
ncbi:MerR family transcriptional regulator [Actinomadura namibiensis]|uniref:DNA-binding transcriptional MerR regulator n=1 Tax=Actinomadura namibiensis TaxID=182080 RepID=A0A7W3LR83_ACTNM|nr:MerR family transcriptional regulator [Actinomadura namibiensis]MBA8952804.1 DNA-binding transcriptional MerR regulator [Actinomadura namibiensis]